MADSRLLLPDAAVVLAGGTGRRLGGADKAALRLGRETLLQRALRVLDGVERLVVVGPEGLATGRAQRVQEEPAYAGPAAALLAGARAVEPAATVLVLAVDMPGVTAETVGRLGAALAGSGASAAAQGAVLHDGRAQPLCCVYRRAALLAAAPADPVGLSVRALVSGLRLVEVPASGAEGADVDDREALEAARERLVEG